MGPVEEAQKVGKIVKSDLSSSDIVVGTSNALEGFGCNDYVCASLDVIGSVSSGVGLVLGNIPSTKHLTLVTDFVTVGSRSIRYYCKNYSTFWGCTIAAGQGIKEAVKFNFKR